MEVQLRNTESLCGTEARADFKATLRLVWIGLLILGQTGSLLQGDFFLFFFLLTIRELGRIR